MAQRKIIRAPPSIRCFARPRELTGHLYDGVNGLYEIQRSGGATIIQDPVDAEVPEIPRNALARLKPDHVLPLAKIASAISELLQTHQRSMQRRSGQ